MFSLFKKIKKSPNYVDRIDLLRYLKQLQRESNTLIYKILQSKPYTLEDIEKLKKIKAKEYATQEILSEGNRILISDFSNKIENNQRIVSNEQIEHILLSFDEKNAARNQNIEEYLAILEKKLREE